MLGTDLQSSYMLGFFLPTEGNLSRVNDILYDARERRWDKVSLRVYEVSHGETCARSVQRPTERYGHVVARNLAARIVEYEATTSRDQDACPQPLHVVTAGPLHVVTGHYM